MKVNILIVDDEQNIRAPLEDMLKLEGYDAVSVGDGEEAIQRLKDGGFDLVILDLKLPGMDGMEVLKTISRLVPDTKVILLTGHGSMESAVGAVRHHVHDYITKPIDPKQLLESIRQALIERSTTQQKQILLEQLDASVRRLREFEGFYATPQAMPNVMVLDEGITIDLNRREIWRGNDRVSLTPTEGKLMKVLIENRSHVLTHRELVTLVQGYDTTDWEAPEVLRPLVSRLRRKLSIFPNGEEWISNVRGTGYVFDPEGKVDKS